ncbi:1233_t:CDS:1 [Dentiscutata heterogama]|uniref:1233_t:CDS:1 n=1 Tax=Dentiscutata heterogama TaxID=1316150 RepID=A0ACA9MVP6_9GLOM|nr:1233_t:CDS:1 [Dentiscutata heterogama]
MLFSTLTLITPPDYDEVISKMTVGDYDLYFTNQAREYRVIYNGRYVIFDISDNKIINSLCEDNSKNVPNAYILFRAKLAPCISALGLSTERVFLSQVSSNLWKDIKEKDKPFIQAIKAAYKIEYSRRTSKRFVPYINKPKKSRRKSNVSYESAGDHPKQRFKSYVEEYLYSNNNEFPINFTPLEMLLWELFNIY